MRRILLAEDDRNVSEAVSDYFQSKDYEVCCCYNGLDAVKEFSDENFDILLLDVMLPQMNGFEICKTVRKSSRIPILFLTARVSEADKLQGYGLGADDYITKPFSLPVLYAKVEAVLDRIQQNTSETCELTYGEIVLCPSEHQVRVQNQECLLAPREYELLKVFLEHPGQVFTREQLLDLVWGYDFTGVDRVVDNHIKKLRKALGEAGTWIQTVNRVGYRLGIMKR